ncbi:MAG TPA: hypothetical protein PKD27_07025, partial [Tepidiformaceae bacterium]|nr:hypothetical protein [Tepidiformaceae bacterium]
GEHPPVPSPPPAHPPPPVSCAPPLLVDRMCAAGLVDRSADTEDRRGRWVEMTASGRSRLVSAAPIHLRGVRDYFTSYLTDAEAASLESALERIAEASRNQL